MSNDALLDRLEGCKTLPALPEVALRMMRTARRNDTSVQDLLPFVEQDPALAAGTLRLANSAAFGLRRRVDSLSQALVLIGMESATEVAMSQILHAGFKAQVRGLGDPFFWRRSLLGAVTVRALSIRSQEESDTLYLAALMQDVGMLGLHSVLGQSYARLVEAVGIDHDGLAAREEAEFGVDHAAAGAWLIRRWELPEALAQVVESSGTHRIPGDRRPQRCLKIAGHITAFALGGEQQPQWPRLEQARRSARAHLELEVDTLAEVLETVEQALPELTAFFKADLGHPLDIRERLEQGRQVLLGQLEPG